MSDLILPPKLDLSLPGTRKVQRTDVKIDPTDNMSGKARDYLGRSAAVCQPKRSKYLGSMVAHVYADQSNPNEFMFATDCTLTGGCHEVWADTAMKTLKTKVMHSFGRTPPKERT